MKNKTRHFRLVDDKVFETLCQHLLEKMTECQKSGEYVFVSVDVGSEERARSLRQNALYWSWVAMIAKEFGGDKDEQHATLKREILTRIYMRSDVQMVKTVRLLGEAKAAMSAPAYEQLAQSVARLMTTTKATVDEFAEYLDDIYKWAYNKGCALPIPDDYSWIVGKA